MPPSHCALLRWRGWGWDLPAGQGGHEPGKGSCVPTSVAILALAATDPPTQEPGWFVTSPLQGPGQLWERGLALGCVPSALP